MFKALRFLAALTMCSFALACSTSSEIPTPDSSAVDLATAKVELALQCPQAPVSLTMCPDGGPPLQTSQGPWCPAPTKVAAAVQSDPLKDAAAEAIGWALLEQKDRLRLHEWGKPCRTHSSVTPASVPNANTPH